MSLYSESITALFDRLRNGLKRFGGEVATKAPEFAVSPDGTQAFALIRRGDGGFEFKTVAQRKRRQRAHVFHDVGSFAGWLKAKGADPKATEILVAENKFTAALNPGEHGGDLVACELQLHPRFARWAKLFDTPMTQAVLLKHLYAVGEDTAQVKGRDGSAMGSQAELMAGELASFTISKDSEAHVEIDQHGRVVLSGSTDKTRTSSKLPTVFNITVPIFRGIEVPGAAEDSAPPPALKPATYTIQVRLYISVKDGVRFTLEAPDLPIVLDAATEDAVAHLTRDLGAGWLVGRGQMKLTETFDRDAGAPGGVAVGAED